MKQFLRQMLRRSVFLSACGVMACSGISRPASVSGASQALGEQIAGARGLEADDQNRIDDAVARGCAIGLISRASCDRHTRISFERRKALTAPGLCGMGPIEVVSTVDADHLKERLPYIWNAIQRHNMAGKEECGWR